MAELAEAFELSDETLERLARNSVEASFASDRRKAELYELIDAWSGVAAID